MTTILDQLAEYARERVRLAKTKMPLEEIRQQAFALPKGTFAFENALKTISFLYLRVQKSISFQRLDFS